MKNINICRTCLQKRPKDKVPFEALKDVFKDLTSLQVEDDGFPEYICSKCGELLAQFRDFKQTCIASDTHFRNILSNKTCLLVPIELIKVEMSMVDSEVVDDAPLKMPKPKSSRAKTSMKKKASQQKQGRPAKKLKRMLSQAEDDDQGSTTPNLEIDEVVIQEESPTQLTGRNKEVSQRLFNCTVSKCKRSFKTKLMLETHLKIHQGIDCTICDICERPLTSVTNMLRHRLTHKSVEERSLKCTVCNKIVTSKQSLVYHMRFHNTTKSFVCDICGKGFTTSWHLKNHWKLHTEKPTIACEQCPKVFKTFSAHYYHVNKSHSKQESVMCNICGTVVVSKRYLFTHCKNMHTVYTTTENVYKCIQCDVRCKTVKSLRTHERLHTGERKHKCPLCSKSYAYRELLKKHSYTHTGEQPYQCHECSKGFSGKWALEVHMNIHKKEWIAEGRQGITLKSKSQGKKKVSNSKESEDSLAESMEDYE